jgi:hypothetical protein
MTSHVSGIFGQGSIEKRNELGCERERERESFCTLIVAQEENFLFLLRGGEGFGLGGGSTIMTQFESIWAGNCERPSG